MSEDNTLTPQDEAKDVAASASAAAKPQGFTLGTPIWAAIAVVCAIAGVLIGRFVLAGGAAGAGGSLGGKTSLTEAELDSTIATYTYNGTSYELTARDVIVETSSLDAMKNEDDTYSVPAADSVISVARNKIVGAEAESRGVTVSDEDLDAYAEETLGSNDYSSIASSYSMDEDSVKELLRESAQMSKLRDEVVDADGGEMPEAPTEPEEGQEEVATAEYAEYIIGLAGDEWDSETGTWKSEDGSYATALADYEVTADSATYEAAQSAYYVAYQDYSEAQSEVSTQWTDFVNELLAKASISISTLVA